MKSITKRTLTFGLSLILLVAPAVNVFGIFPFWKVTANTNLYNFNSTSIESLLSTYFRQGGSTPFTYSADGGLSGSAAINTMEKFSTWTTRYGYELGLSGYYSASAYFKNYYSSGFGALGLTTKFTNGVNGDNIPITNKGISVSFHGGGGDIYNNGEFIQDMSFGGGDLTNGWWFMELVVEPTGEPNTFDVYFEIYPSDSDGELGALKTSHMIEDVENIHIGEAESVFGFFGATDERFDIVDNFYVEGDPVEVEFIAPFPGGSGTEGDPYQIQSCEHLQSINDDSIFLSAHYVITTSHIDCTDTVNWNSGDGFIPIGSNSEPFFGTIDGGDIEGNSATIEGLYISSEDDYIGLFGQVGESDNQLGLITNIILDDVEIDGGSLVGGVAGLLYGEIDNVSVSGSVYGYNEVGGLVGAHMGTGDTIIDSSSSADVYGDWAVGGLVGTNYDSGEIYSSFATGDVTGNATVGGLVGYSGYDSLIIDSHATGDVKGEEYVGGLVGSIYGGRIENSYSIGDISQTIEDDYDYYSIGGLIGESYYTEILNVSSMSNINLNTYTRSIYSIGGLIGSMNEGSVLENGHSEGDIAITVNDPNWNYIENIGGLIGEVCDNDPSCQIQQVSSKGNISITQLGSEENTFLTISDIGGLIGTTDYFDDGVLEESYTESNITINAIEGEVINIGGFIGSIYYDSENAIIQNNYTRSNINVNADGGDIENIGGFIGRNYSNYELLIKNNYSAGNLQIDSNDYYIKDIGGFIGETDRDGDYDNITTFENNFRFGAIELNGIVELERIGGFVGYSRGDNEAYFINNFTYHTSGYNYCYSENSEMNEGCSVVANENVFKNSSNQPLAEWDFDEIWAIVHGENDNFPVLRINFSDEDDDGVPDDIENLAPNFGDGNNDGLQDSDQENVASFVNILTNNYTVLEVDETCTITSVTIGNEGDNEVLDSGYTYPAGMVNFTIECDEGFTTEVSIYEYGVDSETYTLRKHKDNAYFNIDAEILESSIGGGFVVIATYQVTDGGELDLDGEVNGIIIDPVGLGLQSVGVPNTGIGGPSKI